MSVADEVANCLLDRHVVLPRNWLISFLSTECEDRRRRTAADLAEVVYRHVLTSDLRVIKCHTLPPNLANGTTFLHGHFLLQMDSVLDISQPCYNQWKTLKGVDDSNAMVDENERESQHVQHEKLSSSSNRTLSLKLTDGSQVVRGLEWKPTSCIYPTCPPGCKILVHGSIECRRGVLLLCKENTQFLGGTVDSLHPTNCQLAILQSRLQINPLDYGRRGSGDGLRAAAAVSVSRAPQREPLQALNIFNGDASSTRPGRLNAPFGNRQPFTFASEREEEIFWINYEFDLYRQ